MGCAAARRSSLARRRHAPTSRAGDEHVGRHVRLNEVFEVDERAVAIFAASFVRGVEPIGRRVEVEGERVMVVVVVRRRRGHVGDGDGGWAVVLQLRRPKASSLSCKEATTRSSSPNVC